MELNIAGSYKGVRQGDPLSPYLFILVMQLFSALVNDEVASKRLTPFCYKGFSFSHALFADDVIIAMRANKRSCARLLSCFHELSGLRINFSKSAVYFSKWACLRLNLSIRCVIVWVFLRVLSRLNTVCSMISDSRIRVCDQQVFLQRGLNGWKASYLSQAGRITLIQSVLQALPVHVFMAGWSSLSILKKFLKPVFSPEIFYWPRDAPLEMGQGYYEQG